jgi:hypothetical protein
MKRISFDRRFINEAGSDLIPGKIHTLRRNYQFWKKFEGRDTALFTWDGKPYRSGQKVFCVKKIMSVQKAVKHNGKIYLYGASPAQSQLAKNDGLALDEFKEWFKGYPDGDMAVLHFTDFRYGEKRENTGTAAATGAGEKNPETGRKFVKNKNPKIP